MKDEQATASDSTCIHQHHLAQKKEKKKKKFNTFLGADKMDKLQHIF